MEACTEERLKMPFASSLNVVFLILFRGWHFPSESSYDILIMVLLRFEPFKETCYFQKTLQRDVYALWRYLSHGFHHSNNVFTYIDHKLLF